MTEEMKLILDMYCSMNVFHRRLLRRFIDHVEKMREDMGPHSITYEKLEGYADAIAKTDLESLK